MIGDLTLLAAMVEKGDHLGAAKITQELLRQGLKPRQILLDGLQKGLFHLGERFKRDEAYIPEVLLSARAMQTGMALLKPFLIKEGLQPKAKIVIGTVKNDLHDIGKNMVGMMLEASGFEIIDLGVNVPGERFIAALRREQAPLLAMSGLLSTTVPEFKKVIDLLKETGLSQAVKVMVGGAPVTEKFALDIGAQGYAPDAIRAAEVALSLINEP
jgi:5-methyltetrahydrofolate--homocysteine methyltransferase